MRKTNQRVRSATVSVGVTAVVAATAKDRKSFYIANSSTGAQVITVSLGKTAVANEGYVLQPTGSITDSDSGENYFCFDGDISIISDAAGGQISIVEVS